MTAAAGEVTTRGRVPELHQRWVTAAALLCAIVTFVVALRPFDEELNRFFADHVSFALLSATACAAAITRLRGRRSPGNRWSFGALAVAFSFWTAAEILEMLFSRALYEPRLDLTTDLLYLSFYIFVLVAAETVATRSARNRAAFHLEIELLAGVLVVATLLAYFLVLPFNLDPGSPLRSEGWWSFYVLFDILLLLRLVILWRGLPSGEARRFVGWLAGLAALLLAADSLELVSGGNVAGVTSTSVSALYHAVFVLGVIAVQVDLGRSSESGQPLQGHREAEIALPQFSPVLLFVVALPLLHLLLDSVRPASDGLQTARGILVIATEGILGGLAAWSWTSFRRQYLRLLEASERATEALARSRHLESVGRLAAGVAHDFNNRLTVILGYASRLRGRTDDDAVREQAVAAISEAADQASRLTMELLAVGRAQAARRERIDLAEIADELATEARQLAAAGIELALRREGRSLPVEIDRMHLLRMVWNLAANASDSMPDGGRVDLIVGARRIELSRDAAGETIPAGEYALVAIADRGLGMATDTVTRLFDPFFTTKEFGRGSGLGLAAVLGLIRSNGGYVLVESEPGRGSRFEILFPLLERSFEAEHS